MRNADLRQRCATPRPPPDPNADPRSYPVLRPDLMLQPRRTQTETRTINFPEGTVAADIEATLAYQHRPGEEFVVHRVVRKVKF